MRSVERFYYRLAYFLFLFYFYGCLNCGYRLNLPSIKLLLYRATLTLLLSCMLTAFYLLFFHILFLMFLWSYWQTVYTELMPVPDKVIIRVILINSSRMIIHHIFLIFSLKRR